MSEPVPIERLEEQGLSIVEMARAVTIENATQHKTAAQFLLDIKAIDAEIHASCDPVCEATNAAHKAATTQRRKLLAPVSEARDLVRAAMSAWVESEEKRIREENALAEAERREAEQNAQKEAEELEAIGEPELAQHVLEEAELEAPAAAAPIEKVAGVSYRTDWSVEVTDLPALVKAVAEGTVPLSVLVPDMKVVSAAARALKKDLNWPGVRVSSKRIPVTR